MSDGEQAGPEMEETAPVVSEARTQWWAAFRRPVVWGPTAGVAALVAGVLVAVATTGSGASAAADATASPEPSIVVVAADPGAGSEADPEVTAEASAAPSASASPAETPVDSTDLEIGEADDAQRTRMFEFANPLSDEVRSLPQGEYPYTAALSPDEAYLLVESYFDEYSTRIQLIDLATGTDRGPKEWTRASSGAWLPDASHQALVAIPDEKERTTLSVIDAATGDIRDLGIVDGGVARETLVSPDGAWAAVTLAPFDIRQWKLERKTVALVDLSDGSIDILDASAAAGFGPDGRSLYLWTGADSDGSLELYDLATGRSRVGAVPSDAVLDGANLVFSPNGSRAAFVTDADGEDSAVAVVAADGSDYRVLANAGMAVRGLDWVDDATIMAGILAPSEGSVVLIDVASGDTTWKVLRSQVSSSGRIETVTMLPDRSGAVITFMGGKPSYAVAVRWTEPPGEWFTYFYTGESAPALAPVWSADGSVSYWLRDAPRNALPQMLVATRID